MTLKYLGALARGGNIDQSAVNVEKLLADPKLEWKLKARYAQEAAKLDYSAYPLAEDPFPGINAATMTRLADDPKRAHVLATSVIDQVKAKLRRTSKRQNDWLFVTLGEGYLLLDQIPKAASWYGRAVKLARARDEVGEIASMRLNFQLLKQKIGSQVNRAARIEPVTTPGCAFASEQFAAVLALESGHQFVCEYIGVEDLAKGYDRCPLYQLGRSERVPTDADPTLRRGGGPLQ